MASVTSLGIHGPSALPFLVAEGILPTEPSSKLYRWEILSSPLATGNEQEEELLITQHCVVWSRAAAVQRVFRFDVETEPIKQALFTHFDGHGSPEGEAFLADPKVEHSDDSDGLESDIRVHGQLGLGLNVNDGTDGQDDADDGVSRYHHTVLAHDLDRWKRLNRALVVIFKSHAYIFFLSGTSHVVHLPVEVENAFSLPNGLLLQRQPSKLTPLRTTVPPVPQNSFAFEGLAASGVLREHRAHGIVEDERKAATPAISIPSMLDKLLKQASGTTADAKLPSLYCLLDPLAEVGGVITQEQRRIMRHLKGRNAGGVSVFDDPDQAEKLLYVSQPGELGLRATSRCITSEMLVAVSQNQKSHEYTIWSVEYIDRTSSDSAYPSLASKAGRRNSRRRSSYGLGTGTGANTPIPRGSTIGKERLGASKSRASAARDLLSEDSFNEGEDDLVSHLDSALDSQSMPIKSSRRVSSLLARAELSSGVDKTIFSDLATGYPTSTTTRRGASFGAQSVKPSTNTSLSGSFSRTQLNRVRTNIEPNPSIETYSEGLEDSSDEAPSYGNARGSPLRNDFVGLRKEILFTKIYSIASGSTISQQSKAASGPGNLDIFALKAPEHTIRGETEEADAFLCIHDSLATSLLVIGLGLSCAMERSSNNKVKYKDYKSRNAAQYCELRVLNSHSSSGIVDACRMLDTDCYRLVILKRNVDGQNKLYLQDPWHPPSEVPFPAKLFVYNPYHVPGAAFPNQQREGGLKRILSQGPRAFVKLRQGGSKETINITDADGLEHRVQIQLQPRNKVIFTLIKLCDSILPSTHMQGEPILNGWWRMMIWLSTKSDIEGDVEWAAFVVVLFSIAAGFIEDRHAESPARQKRRKTGLLRSSSGANTNLESWEAMLVEESGASSNAPAWMQDEAWSWTTKQPKALTPPRPIGARNPRPPRPSTTSALPPSKKSTYLLNCMSFARDYRKISSPTLTYLNAFPLWTRSDNANAQRVALATLLIGLHLLREEYKLDVLAANAVLQLTPILAQMGGWLQWPSWGFNSSAYYMLENCDMDSWLFDDTRSQRLGTQAPMEPSYPPSIMHFVETATVQPPTSPFPNLVDVVGHQHVNVEYEERYQGWVKVVMDLTPRIAAINELLGSGPGQSIETRVTKLTCLGWDLPVLETLPESIALSFRAAISACQAQPLASSDKAFLDLLGREDINLQRDEHAANRGQSVSIPVHHSDIVRDTHSVCVSTFDIETVGAYDGAAEADRQSTTRTLFNDDQRFSEAAKLLHPLNAPIARCVPEPDWSDSELLEAQQELAKIVAMRTLAVSPGRSCLFYSARLPLLTEKFPIHGFTLSCVMMPSTTTVTADKLAYTEEKVSWAFFHAGVEAGLSISKNARGLGTSWILFNKPQELKNRHAGFLLALGLNGHLKSIAKWVAFKYLTPKHTMTSIGLLLGLAASYLGTMDTLITRLLSVHVTRMLPPGAAELNLSPLTQTSGIMGIGLLYCGTQHRRMSEIMLSEMEHSDEDDNSGSQDSLRDEGYRLAAGFALGYINLGRGKDLKGLHDMRIVERLLALATETRRVTIVHILDKATAAATVAIALIFMKTHNEALARKIDIPDTSHQFEYVRPDIFLLRTVARHLIMWNDIQATQCWLKAQLPTVYHHNAQLTMIRTLSSEDMPFFNIVAGLCLVVGLRYAGTGSIEVRNLLCHYLDQFMRICKLPALNYDGKLARITVRNCQDVVALASACVMAGTGDLPVFRRLRSLHGRIEADVPYGSHLAAHLAIGIIFLGGGTHSFGTSDIAVASLLCAFYPLLPTTVLDNKSHLQAFRHFWVLAAEFRCLMAHDIDTRRLVSLPIKITLRSGSERVMTPPCLIPELDTVAKIQTTNPEYRGVNLDFARDSSSLRVFSQHRGIWVRRRAAYDAEMSLFSTAMQALSDAQSTHVLSKHVFEWVFRLKVFQNLDRAEKALVLPSDIASVTYRSTRGTAIDDRLVLETACMTSGRSEKLWNLRILFAWANAMSRSGGRWGWIGKEVIERLQTRLMMKKVQS